MPIEDVAWAITDLDERADQVNLCRAYYEGHHRVTIPESKTLNRTMRDLLERFRDNLCDDVVDEPVSRTEITNWTAGKNETERKQASQQAADIWAANRGEARSREVHRDFWAIGDGFVIVQRDTRMKPRFYPQQPEVMAVRYSTDDPDRIEVAAKCWKAGKRWRLNLYYPPPVEGGQPTIERYATKASGVDGKRPQARAFEPVTEGMGFGAPAEQLDDDRFPVYHFPADEIGRYGRSALHGVIPLQDGLNKSLNDLLVAMEEHALPGRYATGVQVEFDPVTGQEKPLFRSGKERMYRSGSPNASFGQFPQANLDGFLKVQADLRAAIAREGRLPPHAVGAAETSRAAPSGISLLVMEGAQVKRVTSAQTSILTPTWREVQSHLLALAGITVDPEDIDIEWAPVEARDEQALVETLTGKVAGLGLPKRQALIEDGYAADDVDKWLDDAAAQADAALGGRVSPAGASPFTPRPHLLPPPPATPAGAPASGVSA